MKIALADVNTDGLDFVSKEVQAIQQALPPAESATGPGPNFIVVPTDVSKLEDVVRLKDRVYETWGEVSCASYSRRLGPGAVTLLYGISPPTGASCL